MTIYPSDNAAIFQPGQKIGAYYIQNIMDRGSLTTTYRAHSAHGIPVIITAFTIPPHHLPAFLTRFYQQTDKIARLSHRHLLPLYDAGEHHQIPYLISPEIEQGTTLMNYLRAVRWCSPIQTKAYLDQITQVLSYAHQQHVIHRDIHPANIIIERNQIVVAGWAMSTLVEATGINLNDYKTQPYPHLLNLAGNYQGNPHYLDPAFVSKHYLHRTNDLYAVGILLFEMLAGRPPFQGPDFLSICLAPLSHTIPSLAATRTDITSELDKLISCALNREPQARFATATDLFEAYTRTLHPQWHGSTSPSTSAKTLENAPSLQQHTIHPAQRSTHAPPLHTNTHMDPSATASATAAPLLSPTIPPSPATPINKQNTASQTEPQAILSGQKPIIEQGNTSSTPPGDVLLEHPTSAARETPVPPSEIHSQRVPWLPRFHRHHHHPAFPPTTGKGNANSQTQPYKKHAAHFPVKKHQFQQQERSFNSRPSQPNPRSQREK